MLRQIAEGVLTHGSGFMQSNAVVVQGRAGVLLIDPGVTGDEIACLAGDLRQLGQPVVAGFSTHPHWDHLLWHPRLGEPPRYGTARCGAAIQARLSDPNWQDFIRTRIPPDIADQVPLDLLGLITALPAETARIPWDGPAVRIVEHQAHASGHAALLIEERGVLIAGDMLSDVLIPILDVNTADPIGDYLIGLRLLEGAATDVDVVVPATGPSAEPVRFLHGSPGIAPTCSPCVTHLFLTTLGSAHPPTGRTSSLAFMNVNSSTSPHEGSARGTPQ